MVQKSLQSPLPSHRHTDPVEFNAGQGCFPSVCLLRCKTQNDASPFSVCSHTVQLGSVHPAAAGPKQAALSLLPHQLWSSLIQPAATESLEGILVGIPKQNHFLLLWWIFLFWTRGSFFSSCGIWSKDHWHLYHLLDGAAGGCHLPRSPLVQFYL